MKDTVNTALQLAAGAEREPQDVSAPLDTLAAFDLAAFDLIDREQAWR